MNRPNHIPPAVLAEAASMRALTEAGQIRWVLKPRVLANGSPCCADAKHMCSSCRAHHNGRASYAPPDPYAAGINTLRSANGD